MLLMNKQYESDSLIKLKHQLLVRHLALAIQTSLPSALLDPLQSCAPSSNSTHVAHNIAWYYSTGVYSRRLLPLPRPPHLASEPRAHI